ncbi:ELMO domain-containing protein 2-like [Dreissena polymorpha]|uniref:ELMO domain-containing protein n=1 Tax=Dreissena polymorpha TaxID=45954 RepID=A0A9D4K8N5_DREPO|nr:ELMO domain-containing protein 2-like [Dreissena polymorpha]XP_052281456.1 ELMO domain-containing protein 2-like [Dreissena polymorpha]KAH3835163.1 hypothetical protein DPMN_108509 [Dreissena polymorpha]
MLGELWTGLLACLYSNLRPMFKWALRWATGKCELLRLSYQHSPGALRTKSIEYSLKHSKNGQLNRLVKEADTNIDAAVVIVMKTKYIYPEVHSRFESIFRQSLVQINGYIKLQQTVEELRLVKYSSENADHEKKLMKLWGLLEEEKLTSRVSSQWKTLGFQGDDPMTDFRGMGILGLEQLIYFSSHYPKEAKSILSRSHHPTTGCSFAIVGINMTELVYTLLKKGHLRTHFYNGTQSPPSLQDYHEVYCYAFSEFDAFWLSEKPKDVMEFGPVREKYRKKLTAKLKENNMVLTAKFQDTSS